MSNYLFFFENHFIFFLILIGIVGLAVGSFLNVMIYRYPILLKQQWKKNCYEYLNLNMPTSLPVPLRLFFSRSQCPHCSHIIPIHHNIPIISYIMLNRQCAFCKASISIRYPLVEMGTSLLAILVAFKFGVSIQTLFALLLVFGLIGLSAIDWEHELLPDDITLPLLWLGLLLNSTLTLFEDCHSAILGAVFGYGVLWSVYWLYKLIRKKEGLGFGDFKLLAMLGAWLGFQSLPFIILCSAVLASIVGLYQIIIKKKNKNIPIPFGPFLAISGTIALLWGEKINLFYFTIFTMFTSPI